MTNTDKWILRSIYKYIYAYCGPHSLDQGDLLYSLEREKLMPHLGSKPHLVYYHLGGIGIPLNSWINHIPGVTRPTINGAQRVM